MLKILCDANGIWLMGEYQGKGHNDALSHVRYPLAFQIERKRDDWVMKFGPYDVLGMPEEIRVRLNVLYDPSDNQINQYIDAFERIYRKKYNEPGQL